MSRIAPLVLLLLPFLLAPWLSPYGPSEQLRGFSSQPPGCTPGGPCFPLGTDALGRDVLSRFLHGGLWSILAALLATTVAVVLGAAMGLTAATSRRAGFVLGGVTQIFLSLPWIYLLLALRAVLPLRAPAEWCLVFVACVIGVAGAAAPAQVIRPAALAAWRADHTLAARGFGATLPHLLIRHLLPAVTPVVESQFLTHFPRFIAAETALTFLGLGLPEPAPSWGSLLGSARESIVWGTGWWLLAPAVALTLLTFAAARAASARALCFIALIVLPAHAQPAQQGRYGGRLTVAQRSEPRTLNPLVAMDASTRDVLRMLHGRLGRIDGRTHKAQPELARSWKFSPDMRSAVVELRRDVRFSDGEPFDADDVLFTFEAYLDARTGSPQRDLLQPGGRPVQVTRLDAYRVRFDFAQPYAPGERMFDGIAILPSHLLAAHLKAGTLAQAWPVGTPPERIAGLGPFVLQQVLPGQRLLLRRNPHYHRFGADGRRLPYLDEVAIVFVSDQNAEALRFRSGETDLLVRPNAGAWTALNASPQARDLKFTDAGASLEYQFLAFNMNPVAAGAAAGQHHRRQWFQTDAFRQAVSLVADRSAIVRLAYQGLATPIYHHVTPGNREWHAPVPGAGRSLDRARKLLQQAGFRLQGGQLTDGAGRAVEFSLVHNGANAQHQRIAAILQEDLKQLGIRVQVVPLEFRSLIERIMKTHDYDAALLSLGAGDTDPGAEMNIWTLDGSMHLWNLAAESDSTRWEAEIDRLMRAQLVEPRPAVRKQLYHRVQRLVAEHLPLVCLASPNLLVIARRNLMNLSPSILAPFALWNVEEIYWSAAGGSR